MIGKRREKNRKDRGPGLCLGFLCIMFVLGLFSKAVSWQMKPEVVLRGEESRVLEETRWFRGSVRGGKIEAEGTEDGFWDEEEAEGAVLTVSVYTKDGEAEGWEQGRDLENCLISRTVSYGKWRSVVPVDCLYDRQGQRVRAYMISRVKSSTAPYVAGELSTNVYQEAGGWVSLSWSPIDMVIAQNKAIEDGESVRIKEDEVLDQDGSLEVLAAEGEFFASPFAPWMLSRIFPENYSVEAVEEQGESRIRRICRLTKAGERAEDVRVEFTELLREAGISQQEVQLYSFAETGRWLSLAERTGALILWMTAVAVILVCLYQDARCYGHRLAARCRDEYWNEVFGQEIIPILVRAICYLLGIFTVLYLARRIGGFDLNLVGRLLPPDRVLDFSYYRALCAGQAERREFYCSMFPESAGAQYYAELAAAWRRNAGILAAAAVSGLAVIGAQRKLLNAAGEHKSKHGVL